MRTLAIVGVGLIGGSIALAAQARGVAERIVGVGPSGDRLSNAHKKGMLDAWHREIAPAVEGANTVVVCTPVDQIADQVVEIARYAPPDMLITDVGSTKAVIESDLVRRLPKGACFVGGHPLAGSEKSGLEFADAKLFEDRLVILTPCEFFHADAVVRGTEFWKGLGARVKLMSSVDHDYAVAITSHLPHLLAAVLAGMLPPDLRELAASGFRDTTRIAGGDPALWKAIFEQNQQPIGTAVAEFRAHLSRCLLPGYDGLRMDEVFSHLVDGKRSRDALGS